MAGPARTPEHSMPSASEVSPLETHLGYWLRSVSNHVSRAFKTKVEAHGVTVAEWVVMRALFDADGIKPSVLSEHLGLTRGAISKLVDRLVAKQLVLCHVDLHDRRAQVLHLSDAGRTLVPTLAQLADENDAEMFAPLDPATRARLLATLQELAHHHALEGSPID